MGIASKLLSVLGMRKSTEQSVLEESSTSDESGGSGSEAFGEKSMDDLIRDEEESEEE